jgi:prepilin-type N-terminal cleavage/methylation domain-containing protein
LQYNRPVDTAQKSKELGFTLVELLVVVAIIGILASTAIAQYSVYKQHAVDAKMESTLQAGRSAMEAFFVDNDTYQNSNETILRSNYGFRSAVDVTFKILATTTLTYQLQVCTAGGTSPALIFDSTVGISQQTAACS